MHVDVANSVVINRRVADVSQYAADPDNAPFWYENIKSVEWKTPRPAQVGSQMRTPGPPFSMETTYRWENETGATRMTLRNRGTPRGFSAWLAPLMSFMVGRANRRDLALLKRRLEGGIAAGRALSRPIAVLRA